MEKKIIYSVIFLISISAIFSFIAPKQKSFLTEIGVCTSVANADILAAHGYSYIEENTIRFLMPTKSEEDFNEMLLESQNAVIPVKACNGFIPGNMKSVGPEASHPEILKYVEVAFRRAQKAGIEYIVFGSCGSRGIPDGFSYEEARHQITSLLSKMAPVAAQYDVVVVLEPLNSDECNFINSVTEGGEIVEEVNHPNLRLLADIYHMLKDGEGPESIEKYGHLIHHTHIAEKEERAAPGTHNEDFTAYFQALKNAGYKGKISIECRWDSLEAQAPTAIKAMSSQLSSLKQ